MKKSKIIIKLPPSKPQFLPVTKPNKVIKSEKDYTRKEKHKKKLF